MEDVKNTLCLQKTLSVSFRDLIWEGTARVLGGPFQCLKLKWTHQLSPWIDLQTTPFLFGMFSSFLCPKCQNQLFSLACRKRLSSTRPYFPNYLWYLLSFTGFWQFLSSLNHLLFSYSLEEIPFANLLCNLFFFLPTPPLLPPSPAYQEFCFLLPTDIPKIKKGVLKSLPSWWIT